MTFTASTMESASEQTVSVLCRLLEQGESAQALTMLSQLQDSINEPDQSHVGLLHSALHRASFDVAGQTSASQVALMLVNCGADLCLLAVCTCTGVLFAAASQY
jgi:hypothetical protein